jgi:hypothetical protein
MLILENRLKTFLRWGTARWGGLWPNGEGHDEINGAYLHLHDALRMVVDVLTHVDVDRSDGDLALAFVLSKRAIFFNVS